MSHRSPRAIRRVAASALVVSMFAAGCGSSGGEKAETTSTTSTTTAKTTTTVAETTTTAASVTTTTVPQTQPETAIWPFVDNELRFSDPVDAATSFAGEYLGFPNPTAGAFQAGDARSGEVPMRPKETGPVTTILVRQVTSDDTWWVIGAVTQSIEVDLPAALSGITSPVTLSGRSTAFEATVNVQIRADGSVDPLVEDIVMGGANGEMGPYSKAITYPATEAARGVILLQTFSAEDGSAQEATVVRVAFG